MPVIRSRNLSTLQILEITSLSHPLATERASSKNLITRRYKTRVNPRFLKISNKTLVPLSPSNVIPHRFSSLRAASSLYQRQRVTIFFSFLYNRSQRQMRHLILTIASFASRLLAITFVTLGGERTRTEKSVRT